MRSNVYKDKYEAEVLMNSVFAEANDAAILKKDFSRIGF